MATQASKLQGKQKITLLKLNEVKLNVIDPLEDVRGCKVVDSNGELVGCVEDLLIDSRAAKVRFLLVLPCGHLKNSHSSFLIPADVVAEIARDRVFLDCAFEQVADSPYCYPDWMDEWYLEEIYGYYGFAPHWQTVRVRPT